MQLREASSRWRGRLGAFTSRGGFVRMIAVAVPALAAATALVAVLEGPLGVQNASPVYLLAVVITALAAGTLGALAAAVVGILLYNYLFTVPIHTLEISDPAEWLNLALLLFVGVVVGQLTALERARTLTAKAREREARELFLVSRALATRPSTGAVLPEIAELLRRGADLATLSITLGADEAGQRVAAQSGPPGVGRGGGSLHWVLRRTPGDEPAQWVRIHQAGAARQGRPTGQGTHRVRIEAGGRDLGSIWATRGTGRGQPDRSATRLISAAADQLGQALAQDELAEDARAAEVARQSDALKSALLQSVSHDLRTPLATIRAAAGTLRPGSDLDDPGRLASADAIEREVVRLDRLVTNLLDLGRIEAGALRPELEVFELDDLAGQTVDRFASRFHSQELRVEIGSQPVLVDPVFLDEALTNLLDNAAKFAGPGATIRVSAARVDDTTVRIVVEDSGPGIPDDLAGRVFEPFVRGPAGPSGTRPGTGIGLAVVRGLVEAMAGRVRARPSELGGLAVELDLPLAELPSELGPGTA